jgi:hypothetical protein
MTPKNPKTSKKAERGTPQDWQMDVRNILTERVQYWRGGVMVSGQMSKGEAQRLVATGAAFVMSEQAIGALTADGRYNS